MLHETLMNDAKQSDTKQPDAKQADAKQADAKRPETVLIIDDTPDNLRFLSELLNRAGYTVRKVISGELGLEAAQLEPPDLILLDIRMPELDGYQVCAQLKSSERTRAIPVIFLSAMSEELDKVMAFEAGCVDYITKPFQVAEVLARIENQLQVSRLRQALEQQNAQFQATIAQLTSAETALKTLMRAVESLELLKSPLTPQLQKTLQEITTSTRLIQSILARRLPDPAAEPLRAAELPQFCQRLLAQWPLLDPALHHLAFVSWGDPTGALLLDAEGLKQALTPILANALQYSPQGGSILLQLTCEPSYVEFQIRDAGIGIPPAELDRICGQFYRASNAIAAGQGLGLFEVQQLVTAQGGSLSFRSQLGVGTTVTLTLPLQPESQPNAARFTY